MKTITFPGKGTWSKIPESRLVCRGGDIEIKQVHDDVLAAVGIYENQEAVCQRIDPAKVKERDTCVVKFKTIPEEERVGRLRYIDETHMRLTSLDGQEYIDFSLGEVGRISLVIQRQNGPDEFGHFDRPRSLETDGAASQNPPIRQRK